MEDAEAEVDTEGKEAMKDTAAATTEIEEMLLKPLRRDTPKWPLFHYTDSKGFRGIIESREIWATHFDYLNDSSELRHGEDLVREEAQKVLGRVSERSRQHRFLEEFANGYPQRRWTSIANLYIASLSESADHLSQWRAYGTDGAGYAIGFGSLPVPHDEREGAQAGLTLVKCEYEAEPFRETVRDVLFKAAALFEKHTIGHAPSTPVFDWVLAEVLNHCLKRFAAEVPRIKDGAFVEEREWRLVVYPSLGREQEFVKFRSSTAGLCPYVEVGVGGRDNRIDLASVIIGPGQDRDRSVRAAKMFLKYRGYDEERVVRVSELPYRGGKG